MKRMPFLLLLGLMALGLGSWTSFGQEKSGDFIYNTINGVVRIERYTGTNSVIDIPKTINNKSVSIVGARTFENCTNITSITIPEDVSSLEEFAFFNCKNLTTINIPSSVTNIGNSTFLFCNKLSDINIPDVVTNIGEQAFGSCKTLVAKAL